MTVLAHISDIHFGTERSELVEAIAADLEALAPDVVVVSGDLTQRARRAQFRAARAFLDALPGRWVAVPGNHDIPLYDLPRRIVSPKGRFRTHIGPTQTLLAAPGLRLLAVDTARPERHARGRVHRRDLAAIEALGDGDPADLRVLVGHHPFDERAHRAAARGRVDVLMTGHLHRGRHAPIEIEEHGMLELHAGTAFSHRVRDRHPNSWNVLRRDGERLEAEVRSWDGRRFVAAPPVSFRRTRRAD